MAIFRQSETRVGDCAVAVLKLCAGDPALCCPPTTQQHTARQSERRSLSSSWQRGAKLRGSFSVDEFSVELTDAVAPIHVFAEFCLFGAAESFFFQGIQL